MDMKEYTINNKKYKFEKGNEEIINTEELNEMVTEYFDDYDYIFGDMAYNKLRLKGFYESENKKANNINNIKNMDNYLKNYCSYGCKYFLIKKCK